MCLFCGLQSDAAKSAQNIHVVTAAAVEPKADVEKGWVTFCHTS